MLKEQTKKKLLAKATRFCGALRKDALAKKFSMCLSFHTDVVAFVKLKNNIFLLSSSSFSVKKKKIGNFSALFL